MFIEGGSKSNETVLMSLTGNFDLNEISILTDKMRIPGGDDLKKATRKKKIMKTIYSITIFSVCYLPVVLQNRRCKVLCRKHGK
jgi:hypothetical protein